jgi:hypothetical protein
MAIIFVNAGAAAGGGAGDLSVTPPATVTNDVMVCVVGAEDNVALSFPAGWTIRVEQNNTTGLRTTVAWKRAVGTEGAFTITHTAGGDILARVANYRGCNAFGDPFSASAIANNAGLVAPPIVPKFPNCMVLYVIAYQANISPAAPYRAVDPLILTERFNSTQGSGGGKQGIILADGLKSKDIATSTGAARTGLTGLNSSALLALTPVEVILTSGGDMLVSDNKIVVGSI